MNNKEMGAVNNGREQKRTLKPRIRFPEFREAEEWKKKQIGQIADLHKGKGISKSDIAADGMQPCIRYGELYTTYGAVISEPVSKTNLNASDLFLSKKNDVIIPASGETKIDIATASCVTRDNVALGGDINIIRSRENGIFLSYYLNGALKNDIAKIAQGDTVVHLYKTQLEPLDIAIPSRREQQKIANCLFSVDEVITAEIRKRDFLVIQKKGLIQQLFPAGGAETPRLRFPEFQEAGEWEVRPLGKFIEEFLEKSSIQDEFEVLTSARSGLVRQREYYDNDRIADRDNIGFNIIPPNYLTYRSRSDDRRFYFNQNNLGITGIVSIYYPVFRILLGNSKFFVELLSRYSENIGKHSVGTSQTVLSLNELRRIKLPVPSEVEQRRVADCLSSYDALINTQNKKIDVLKAHKRGLMQQLFPSMDEAKE